MNVKNEYVVDLPREGISVEGYYNLPKRGTIYASTPRHAVSMFVFRNQPQTGELILDSLKKKSPDCDLGRYAFTLPEMSPEITVETSRGFEEVSKRDIYETRVEILAQEIASAQGRRKSHPTRKDISTAEELLNLSEFIRAKRAYEQRVQGASLV